MFEVCVRWKSGNQMMDTTIAMCDKVDNARKIASFWAQDQKVNTNVKDAKTGEILNAFGA